MVEFRAENKPSIALTLGGQAQITFTAPKSVVWALEELPEMALTVTVQEYREKRSLSQNAYLWVLLDKLGEKLNRSKVDIYKELVRDYGVFEILPIRNDSAAKFMRNWGKKGLGWVCEDMGDSKLNGYTKVIAYYGSSTYNTKEMTRLIDAVIFECREQGIQTMPLRDVLLLQNDND